MRKTKIGILSAMVVGLWAGSAFAQTLYTEPFDSGSGTFAYGSWEGSGSTISGGQLAVTATTNGGLGKDVTGSGIALDNYRVSSVTLLNLADSNQGSPLTFKLLSGDINPDENVITRVGLGVQYQISGVGAPGNGNRTLYFDPTLDQYATGGFGMAFIEVTSSDASTLAPVGSQLYFETGTAAVGILNQIAAGTYSGTGSNGATLSAFNYNTDAFSQWSLGGTYSGQTLNFTTDGFQIVAIPEPGTFALLSVGMAGAALAFRRRKLA